MNKLFPIYVKLEQTHTLLVGAGAVGLEKIQAMLANSPEARIDVVSREVSTDFLHFIAGRHHINLETRDFRDDDIKQKHMVVVASNNPTLNAHIKKLCQAQKTLLNVADKPDLCDFYLGSVVQKGNLKIGISTNGLSPTMAKRIKQFLNEIIPEEIDETLQLMSALRDELKGDLKEKIVVLNQHTETLIEQKKQHDRAN